MDIARARWLVSPAGQSALGTLDALLAGLSPTALATTLRKRFPPEEAAALAEQVTLRAKAIDRFGEDLGMLFTAEGLEMMTHPAVARRRATRLASLGRPLIDLTCGIGGDLRSASAVGLSAVGLDRDRVTAMLAAQNVPDTPVVQGEATSPPFEVSRFTVLIDPARRSGVARSFDPRAFSPPWDMCIALLREALAGVLKAPPGIDHRHLPPDSEVEFVQVRRSLREATLWLGEGAVPGLRRAVLLPGEHELTSAEPATGEPPGDLQRYLHDPESCVTRAGLVLQLAARLHARQLDRQVAYLTGDSLLFDPLAATFEVMDSLPFSLSRLRQHLRVRGLRPDEIRRRAFPIEPDELRNLLGKLQGEPVTLFLTTVAGKRAAVIARRINPPRD